LVTEEVKLRILLPRLKAGAIKSALAMKKEERLSL
jgi:hypothetical protein